MRIFNKTVIQIHNVQDIQKLAFVFMQALNLNVKNAFWIKEIILFVLEVICKSLFVSLFNSNEFFKRSIVINIFFKPF